MINLVNVEKAAGDGKCVFLPFYKNGKPIDGAEWALSLRKAGSMRFRWNEQNPVRDAFLSEVADGKTVVPVELDHTKIVLAVNNADDTNRKVADGIITQNPDLMPVVTVADCVPIYFFDPVSRFFGIVHSGWKGTGIAGEALRLAEKMYGTKPSDICVAIGPHIKNCCYVVDEKRAEYFAENFSDECIEPVKAGEKLCRGAYYSWDFGTGRLYRLSLEKANLFVLKKAGIPEENIVCATDCTCCSEIFGSNRRETSSGATFTVQAAFVRVL